MIYYKVKKPDMLFRFNGYLQTIPNEIFTPAEVKRYSKPDKHGCRLRDEWLEPVNISKNKVHWFFGARFADE